MATGVAEAPPLALEVFSLPPWVDSLPPNCCLLLLRGAALALVESVFCCSFDDASASDASLKGTPRELLPPPLPPLPLPRPLDLLPGPLPPREGPVGTEPEA